MMAFIKKIFILLLSHKVKPQPQTYIVKTRLKLSVRRHLRSAVTNKPNILFMISRLLCQKSAKKIVIV